jgi:hypothetical protein
VLGIRGVRHDHPSLQGKHTHLLVALETVVIAVVVGETYLGATSSPL